MLLDIILAHFFIFPLCVIIKRKEESSKNEIFKTIYIHNGLCRCRFDFSGGAK